MGSGSSQAAPRPAGTLEGLTRSGRAGKARGKQDGRRRTEQPCRHRRNIWVYLKQQQEARKLGSDMIEWAFHKPLASGGDRDLGEAGAPGSSASRLAAWLRPQTTVTWTEREEAEVEKRTFD